MTRRHTPESRPRVQKPLVHVIGPQVVSSQAPLSQALLEVLHWFIQSIVTGTLGGADCCPHVAGEETAAERLPAGSILLPPTDTVLAVRVLCAQPLSGSNANSNNCNKLHEMTYPCYYYPPAARPCVRPLTCIISFSLHNNTGRQVLLLYTLESC